MKNKKDIKEESDEEFLKRMKKKIDIRLGYIEKLKEKIEEEEEG